MKIQVVSGNQAKVKTDLLVLPIFEESKHPDYGGFVAQFLKETPKFGKLYDTQLIYEDGKRTLLVGAGKEKNWDFEKFQNWAGTAAKFALSKFKDITIIPRYQNFTPLKAGEAFALGIELATHDPTKDYQSADKEPIKLKTVSIWVEKAENGLVSGIKKGHVIADSMN